MHYIQIICISKIKLKKINLQIQSPKNSLLILFFYNLDNKGAKAKVDQVEEVNSMQLLNDELNSNQTKLQVLVGNRERIFAKKQMLLDTVQKFNTLGKYT